MKILFFVSSLNAGGAERVATTLANAWAARGDEVTLVPTYLTKQTSFYPVDKRVALHWLSECPGRVLSRYLPGIGKWLQIRRLIRTNRPDVVVSFLTNVNVNVLIASLGMPVPVIVSERTNPAYSDSAGKLLRLLRRLVYRRARYVVMQTQASVEPFKTLVPAARDVVVIPNPLPPALLERYPTPVMAQTPALTEENAVLVPVEQPAPGTPVVDRASEAVLAVARPSPGERRHLVAMGRLVAIKQFDLLIDAFGQQAARHPDWHLTIWGDGPLRDSLHNQIDGMGLADRITLAGRTSEPWDALSAADLFVMTSRVEGFPNVLLEAMALGLPCVALDCPSGPAELTRNGKDARLLPLNDSQALITTLDELMRDASKRQQLGLRAARSVRQHYGLPAILMRWDALF